MSDSNTTTLAEAIQGNATATDPGMVQSAEVPVDELLVEELPPFELALLQFAGIQPCSD
jgi:hypothetical protein